MAEEDIEFLAVSEKSELDSVDNKEWLRQNSISKSSSPKKNQRVTPNVLRASTGSCHDFCKYGIKHGSEHEEKRPWRKKIMSTSKNRVVTVALPERRKSMVSRSVSFPVNKSPLFQDEASSGAVISPHLPEIIKREITLPRKKFEASSKQDRSSDRMMLNKTDFSEKQSPSALKQPPSYNSVQSGQNRKKDERMSYSSPNISPPLLSQQVKARLSSSVARLQPAKARLSSAMQTGGSIKETGCTSSETIKSSKIKSNRFPHSIQAAGNPNGRNKKSEVKISSQSARTVNERGKRSDNNKTKNNTAAFSSAAKQTLASNRLSSSGTTAIKPRKIGSLKVVSPLEDQNRMQKMEIGKTSDENVPEKTLHVVEVETKAKLSESAEAGAGDITPPLSPAHEEVEVLGIDPHPSQLNLSPILYLKQGMSLSAHEEVGEAKPEAGKGEENDEEEEDAGGDEVKEEEKEQLHQEDGGGENVEEEEEGEMETEEDSDDGEEEEYIDESDEGGEFINDNEIFNYDDLSAVEGNHCSKPMKKGYIVSDSKDSEQVKLKFRRGKVLDIQSENKGPRRLRFRRGRIVEESQGSKNETNRRNFSRRDVSKGNIDSTSDEKIVLRHQDLQGKKDGSLLNIVLEETASKLVETRKSKVKALVGAFETVISLHDRKPSAQSVA